MERRDFFKQSAVLAMATGLTAEFSHQAQAAMPPQTSTFAGKEGKTIPEWGDNQVEHMTTYNPDFADKNLWIRKDNQALTTYRTNPNQKYPYFYPLVGPVSRVSVVSESAQPWPHHRGVFCCGVDKCNGGNYWQSTRDDGRVISQEVKVISAEKTKVEFTDRCFWLRKDVDPFIEDHRRYVIDWRCDDYYLLDLYYTMNMLTDVEILKTNHGFFGVRVEQDLAPDSGGILVNAEGVVGEKETLGTSSNWMAFYGKRRFNPEITEGVAVFSPPNDPFGAFEKTPWFTRDYGNISPMPFNFVKDDYKFRFPLGSEIKVQYRIVVFAGTPSDVDLNGLWKEFYA